MFQPSGVKGLLQMRSSCPARPQSELARARTDHGIDAEELLRPPTAPPTVGPRLMDYPQLTECSKESPQLAALVAGLQAAEVEEEAQENPGELLAEVSTVLHELQRGWAEERRDEIDVVWSQC